MAARELLKYKDIKEIVLVDLDPFMIALATDNLSISALNESSLASPKVTILTMDAFEYLQRNRLPFDMVVADLPDPNNSGLARLYSKQFYRLVRQNLAANGLFVTQATSPYFAPSAFWTIAATVEAGGFATVYPYHLNVPSFGEWGFVMATDRRLQIDDPHLSVTTRFLTTAGIVKHFDFDKDTLVGNVAISTLDRPVVLDRYLDGWQYYR